MLDNLISLEQSAFILGRMITDNALVAFECIHYIKQEEDPTKSFCAYKIDLSKAYDRFDWAFLKKVMQKMGFSHRWGSLLDSFTPSRGLRQGDPLSPFLFLFIADGLSALLNHGVRSNDITLVKIY